MFLLFLTGFIFCYESFKSFLRKRSIKKKVCLVLFSNRLNKIASVNKRMAILLLKNDTKMAMTAAPTGKRMRILASSFSVLVNDAFSIVFDLMTYWRILKSERPIKIILSAKKMIAVLE